MRYIEFPCGCKFQNKSASKSDEEGDAKRVEFGERITETIICDVENITLDCPATWKLIASGNTKGVFQLESSHGRQWSERIKPNNLEDISAVNALLRPGCLRAMSGDPPKSMTERYADRKNGIEDVEFFHSALFPILKDTFGVLTYQEQAMRIATDTAGFNKQEADILRKAIGKKKADIMAQVEKNFLTKAKTSGILSEEEAKEIFGWVRESQKYSFNKSHSICYGKNAYWSAYIKAHFPVNFFCNWLRGADWKGQKKYQEIKELVNDARLNDIDIWLPDLRDMKTTFHIRKEYKKRIFFGLSEIRGIGAASIHKIQNNVKGLCDSVGKDLKKFSWLEIIFYATSIMSSTVTKGLISAGALDWTKLYRNQMLYEFNIWEQLTKKEQEWLQNSYQEYEWKTFQEALEALEPTKKNGGGCHTESRSEKVHAHIQMLEKPPHSLDDEPAWLAATEQNMLGVAVSCSAVDACLDASKANCTCLEFAQNPSRGVVILAVEIESERMVKTKRGKNPGQSMAFLTVSDSSCGLDDVVCWPSSYKKYRPLIYEGNTVLIQGQKNKRGNGLVVEKVWPI
jgi:DNA polymerase III alpha subunit